MALPNVASYFDPGDSGAVRRGATIATILVLEHVPETTRPGRCSASAASATSLRCSR